MQVDRQEQRERESLNFKPLCMHQYVDVAKNLSIEETWSEFSFLNQMSLFRRTTSAGTNPITLNFSSCMISPESVV